MSNPIQGPRVALKLSEIFLARYLITPNYCALEITNMGPIVVYGGDIVWVGRLHLLWLDAVRMSSTIISCLASYSSGFALGHERSKR